MIKASEIKVIKDICGIIVTYFPDKTILDKLITASLQEIEKIIIVNNSYTKEVNSYLSSLQCERISIINNPENLGLANALNIGIEAALKSFSYIVLFDQDSIPEKDMIRNLFQAYQNIKACGIKVGSVGPRHYDPRSGYISNFKSGQKKIGINNNIFKNDLISIGEVPYLQTSGSLFSKEIFAEIGTMENGLFIHHIDLEWCFRARSQGYRFFGINNALMSHIVGDEVLRLALLKHRDIHLNNPLRNYYIARNTMLLNYRGYVPFFWKIKYSTKVFLLFLIHFFFTKERFGHLNMMTKGIINGLIKS